METKEDNNVGKMDNVLVNRTDLLEIIRENKEIHNNIYKEACEKYEKALDEFLNKKKAFFEKAIEDTKVSFEDACSKFLKQREEGGNLTFSFSHLIKETEDNRDVLLPEPPISYEDDYDKAIRKLELNVNDRISLNEKEFSSFVMNDWEWKNNFLVVNSMYVSGCSSTFNKK